MTIDNLYTFDESSAARASWAVFTISPSPAQHKYVTCRRQCWNCERLSPSRARFPAASSQKRRRLSSGRHECEFDATHLVIRRPFL